MMENSYTACNPYKTCPNCLVMDWCRRRFDASTLPSDYAINPDCNGYILLEKAYQLSSIPLEFRYANKRNFLFDRDNVEYREKLFNIFDNVTTLVDDGINLAFIHPQKGTGKTRAACTIGMEYIFRTCMNPEKFDFENPLVLYVKYGMWANDIRQMYQLNDTDYNLKMAKMVKKMKEVPLLILDDIGSGRITPIIRDMTYDIVDYRKEHRKATIYTTNIPINVLETPDYLSDIIVSRMLFNTMVLQLKGRDRRRDRTSFL